MSVIIVCDEEIRITNDIVEILEWKEREIKGFDVPLLHNFLPININKCFVANLGQHVNHKKKNDELVFFRPIKNGRHCQFLMDYMYENEEDIESIDIVVDKNEKYRNYTGKITLSDGETIKIGSFLTENEAKVALFLLYYNGVDESKAIRQIHKFNDIHKGEEKKTRTRKKR